ncbi:hypothetical protein D3C74_352550 [compost metagenome]
MYLATAGPWTASFARPRKNVFQPFLVMSGLVADADSDGRPAWLKTSPVAEVSPENAGPRSAMTLASPTICGATWVAFCGSPSVSNSLMVTWQPAFAALNASTATLAP